MSLFSSILVPLDGSEIAARSMRCASWLGCRLHSRLHVVSASALGLPARAELQRLRVPEECWPLVDLHQEPTPEFPEQAILAAIERYGAQLVAMSARGEGAEAELELAAGSEGLAVVGHVTRAVIERSPVPCCWCLRPTVSTCRGGGCWCR